MTGLEIVDEWVDELGDELILLDGLNDAIIGVAVVHTQPTRVAYSYSKIIEILAQGGMTIDEADEYFSFNIQSLWAGPNTPTIIFDS